MTLIQVQSFWHAGQIRLETLSNNLNEYKIQVHFAAHQCNTCLRAKNNNPPMHSLYPPPPAKSSYRMVFWGPTHHVKWVAMLQSWFCACVQRNECYAHKANLCSSIVTSAIDCLHVFSCWSLLLHCFLTLDK